MKKAKRKSAMKRWPITPKSKRSAPVKPNPAENFCTIGARFLDGPNPFKIFTYQIPRGRSVHLGQELIADTPTGPRLCICVRLDATYNPEAYPGEIKTITRRAAPL